MATRPAKANEQPPIIFFDGMCGLCNGFVDFLIRADKAQVFRFSPLQGEAAGRVLGTTGEYSLDSVVLVEGDRVSSKSTAALRIFRRLGGIWSLLWALRWVPLPVRDGIYEWIARNRYRLFGEKETCRIPSPEERTRFLD
ncbi:MULTISPECIES: thiol-disulfide oxidoreductase DCC family protein [unclassified Nitrospina]|uniref:thiol-disulfide oxidoreductase DCC family protein n=1 Tax=unclassified Nitrospina TaxID=2638683 RepID=UPI003F9C16D2